MPGVRLLEVTEANRDTLLDGIVRLAKAGCEREKP
jgi:hypothetical protein